MEHVRISLSILTLMLGPWAAFYAWQIAKSYGYSFLKPIVYFIVFYNLVILIDLTAIYSCINLLRDCLFYRSTAYAKILGPLSSFFFFLMVFDFLFSISYDISNRQSLPFETDSIDDVG